MRRAPRRLAVDAAHDQLAAVAVGEEPAQGAQGGGRDRRIVERGQGLERACRRGPGTATARPSTRTTYAPAARWKGRRSVSPRRGHGTAAPYGLAGIGGGEEVDGGRVAGLRSPARGRSAAGPGRRRARTGPRRARRRSSRGGSGPPPPARGASGRPPRSRPPGPRPSRPRGRGRRAGPAAPGRAGGGARSGWSGGDDASQMPLPTSDQRPAASGGPSEVSRPAAARGRPRSTTAPAASSGALAAARTCRS